jgi:capsid protein
LTPTAGSYVISRAETNPESFKQLCPSDNIHLINAGYDASTLEPLVLALARSIAAMKEVKEKEQEPKENPAG